jgi:hypothetical protein
LVSGLSLLDALTPLSAGASGPANTALAWLVGQQMADALALHDALRGAEGLRRATAVWLPQATTPRDAFAAALQPFGIDLKALDFSDPEALPQINAWVAERTNNLIPALLDRLPRDGEMVITAALHFAARWTEAFDPSVTQPGAFTRGDGRRLEARFMRATRTLAYAESRSWQAVRIPYVGDTFEAVVLAHDGAAAAHEEILRSTPPAGALPAWIDGSAGDPDERVVLTHNWDELRRTMWDYVGIVRSTKRLQRARTRIGTLSDEVREYYWNFRVEPRLLELRNLIQVAELIIDCALQRRESRGLHFTLDYPAKLAEARHTSVRRPLSRA